MNRPTPFIPVSTLNVNPPVNWTAARTLAPETGATKLLIQCFTQNIRYTLDGTNPTAAVGFQLKAGDAPREINVASGVTIKVIEEAATAVVQFQWGR